MVGRPEHLDGALFAVVGHDDAQAGLLIGGKRVADPGDGLDQFIPADLFAQVAVVPECEVAKGTARRKGNDECADVGADSGQPGKEDGFDGEPRRPPQAREPAFAGHSAHRQQHGIGGRQVVEAAFCNPEQGQRDQVHPGQHAKAPVAQVEHDPGEPQGSCKEIDVEQELAFEKALGAALIDVADVDVLKKVVRNEVVTRQPDQVGQKDETSDADARPEPSACEITPRPREDETTQDSGDEKHDGVLGEEPEADGRARTEPPARVFCSEHADREIGDQHPPQEIE